MPLHPQSKWLLDQIAHENRAPWHELPPNRSRELFASFTSAFGNGPEVFQVEDQRLGDVPCRIYRPAAEADRPVIVYFHGGGWVIGNLDTHDSLCRRLAAETGFTVVAVDYRLAPEHKYPAAMDDAYNATRFIADHAADLKVNSNQLVVAGDSAGGNLAAAVSLRARDADDWPRIKGQVLIYPVIDTDFQTSSYRQFGIGHGLTSVTMEWFWDQYLGQTNNGENSDQRYAKLGTLDLQGLPPTHVITAEYDVLRDEGESFAAKAEAANVSTSLRRYDGMLHGFVHYAGVFDTAIEATRDIAEVVQKMIS